jgi:hypothetical protein
MSEEERLKELEMRLEQHTMESHMYHKTLTDAVDNLSEQLKPIVEGLQAGKLSYIFLLKSAAFIAAMGGLILLFREIRN